MVYHHFPGTMKNTNSKHVLYSEEIAIKIPKLTPSSPESIQDFYQEANTALKLDHENVLKCHGLSFGKH